MDNPCLRLIAASVGSATRPQADVMPMRQGEMRAVAELVMRSFLAIPMHSN